MVLSVRHRNKKNLILESVFIVLKQNTGKPDG